MTTGTAVPENLLVGNVQAHVMDCGGQNFTGRYPPNSAQLGIQPRSPLSGMIMLVVLVGENLYRRRQQRL
jgi:hypothetical protein